MRFVNENVNKMADMIAQSGVSARYGSAILNMVNDLTEEAGTAYNSLVTRSYSDRHIAARLSKFTAGVVNGAAESKFCQYVVKDGDTKIGTAIFELRSKVENCENVCAFFKMEGDKTLYSISAPNPCVDTDDMHNWCMAVLIDLAMMAILRKEVQQNG